MTLREAIIVPVGYLVAVCVSAISVLVLFSMTELVEGTGGGFTTVFRYDGETVMAALAITAATALVPFLIALVILHFTGRTGWLGHVIAGMCVSLFAQFAVWFGAMPRVSDVIDSWPLTAGGAIAGFSYWATRQVILRLLPA
ncbi:MAG: hypothetical protein KIT02_15515 [Devosia sp.]|uniref:hypothetical protein n=1 Tax=Devosia sp. TaxID=1871048 RepID=UPI0024C5CA75|nr:hypothetical protein [Devosia sp.]UYN99302.1 MAG: hypothetical protein KIT02_15515 [Devosia sp.]